MLRAVARAGLCRAGGWRGPSAVSRCAETAAYIEIWARASSPSAYQASLCERGAAAGLASRRLRGVVRVLVMLIVHLLLSSSSCSAAGQVAEVIRAPARPRGRSGRVAQSRRRPWHLLAIALDLALWAVWALEYPQRLRAAAAVFCRHHCGRTDRRLATIVVLSLIDRGSVSARISCSAFPAENRANRYLPLLRKIVSAIIAFHPASLHCLKSGVWMPSSVLRARSATGVCRRS